MLLRKPVYFWQKVAFTDKTRMKLSNDGVVRVFRRNGARLDEKSTLHVTKYPKSLMFWNPIRLGGLTYLVLCLDRMNTKGYWKVS